MLLCAQESTGTCFIYGRWTAYNAYFDSLTFSYFTIIETARDLHEFYYRPSLLLFKRQKNYATQSLDSKLQVIIGVLKQKTYILQIEK